MGRPEREPRFQPPPPAVRAFLDLLQEPAALLDGHGRVRAAGRTLAAWLGRRGPGECARRAFLDFVYEPDRGAVTAALERAVGREPVAVECRLRAVDGSLRPVEAVFADRRGRAPLRGLLVTLRDRSARHASEALAADSQLRLDLALWGSQIGFWDADLVRDTTHWLTGWCESLGIEPCDGADHVARWDALIHPEDRERARAAYEACLAGTREYYEAEYRYARRASGWLWIRERGRVVERAPDGAPLRVIGTCVDIDALKSTEERLRSVQARLDLALEAAQLPVWEWRVHEGTVTIDRPGQAAQVEPRLHRVHADDAARVGAALAGAASGRDAPFEVEYRRCTARGEWQWVVDRGRVTESDAGGVRVIRGVTIDIDDRKRLEAAVLDAVNREQQRLGRELHDGLSQELTGAALLLASALTRLDRIGDADCASIRDALEVVRTAIATSRRIAQGLSSMSLREGGLEDALTQLARHLSAASGVPVSFVRPHAVPVALDDVQVEHLYRIAAEAATNALRHAGPTEIRVELDTGDGGVRLAVCDDGCGIVASRIGAGLGTRIMKYRADVLGARFRIERSAPRGTLVECLCPGRPAPRGAEADTAS